MKKRIVLLTGSELRHEFFRKLMAAADDIEVLTTFCESRKGNIAEVVAKTEHPNDLRSQHLAARKQTEIDFFQLYCTQAEDLSHPVFIEKGAINEEENVAAIIAMKPDLIIAYGCSIIRSRLLNTFSGRFLNIHLGLSPYYRGSGTNFWPFVNGELQFLGTTFMHIDAGIDTGEIVHQLRAGICHGDNVHHIGNRLILASVEACIKIVGAFDRLSPMEPPERAEKTDRYYRNKDFTEVAVGEMYANMANGLVDRYLAQKDAVDALFPIICNPAIDRPS
jgi:phosphoribosylglycinamide formyltransferase 1